MYDRDTLKSRGYVDGSLINSYGYVEFASKALMEKAVDLNQEEFGGRRLRVWMVTLNPR